MHACPKVRNRKSAVGTAIESGLLYSTLINVIEKSKGNTIKDSVLI